MSAVTRREVAEAVRPALAWGARDGDELASYAMTSGAREGVVLALKTLPRRRYTGVADLWPDLPDVKDADS
ncbi:DUF2795 domain-containing protein [Georgenia daeguensis]|uniref:Uncharacterized protein n=1 Tax=Georgenia daeguensis TaxID=908355 RepID=A0ABP8EYJ1_9MICO